MHRFGQDCKQLDLAKSEKATPALRVSHRGNLRVIHFFKGSDLWAHISALESDEGTFVAHLVAVVRRAENSEHFATFLVLVALRLDLVAPDEHSESVIVEESLRNVWAEHDADATLRGMAPVHVAGVRPERLNHDAFIARLSLTID